MRLPRLFRPEIFQGIKKKINYFEGWYFKCVDEKAKNVMAFIPGVSYGNNTEESHAFIQVIDASRNRSGYFSFPISDFKYAKDTLDLQIGKNSFSEDGLTLFLDNGAMSYMGSLHFNDPQHFPKSLCCPGIMGPFSFLPFMECYHGIVHVNSCISGSLFIDSKEHDFDNGTGYIEKDWGTSFPESWIWVQCNHFSVPNMSFMLSYAHIPFLGRSFNGLISFLSINNKLYKLATYNGARIDFLEYKNNTLSVLAESPRHTLNMTVTIKPGNELKAPKKGIMTNNIIESMTSDIDLSFISKKGKLIFTGRGTVAGVEMGGSFSDN